MTIPLGRMGCLGCDGTYAIGFMRCPHCGTRSPMYPKTEGEDVMAKATSGGASNAAEVVEDDGSVSVAMAWGGDEPAVEETAVVAPVEEDPAPGTVPVIVGEAGPELVMLGSPGYLHGADGLEVLITAPDPSALEHVSAADAAAGYTDLTFAELRAEAKTRGLPAGGTAVELAARLADHDTSTAPVVGE